MEQIVTAGRTTIIMIKPSRFIDSHEGPLGEQLTEHLARHGATVNFSADRECPSRAIADRVLAESADLIVAGPLAMRVCGKKCSAASRKTY
jgi:hypothetical protein